MTEQDHGPHPARRRGGPTPRPGSPTSRHAGRRPGDRPGRSAQAIGPEPAAAAGRSLRCTGMAQEGLTTAQRHGRSSRGCARRPAAWSWRSATTGAAPGQGNRPPTAARLIGMGGPHGSSMGGTRCGPQRRTGGWLVRASAPVHAPQEVLPLSVLLVDDQPLTCLGFSAILTSQEDMEVAERPRTAEDAGARRGPRPGRGCMDVQMLRLDGIEATRRLVASAFRAAARTSPR
ncbi:hypothetical protein QJS66_07230 [Kocuria rhizophila]|nr:hypothetical protein QJS66_07230 [Kocuria rhizophila]